jgi:tRNA pseudouridine55 synthase
MSVHGVLNLIKPPGMTSHDAVAFVRRVLKEKRVGHTGTLDPAAAGVLPICVGQATRLVEYLQAGTKEYIAEATFGFETDAGDRLGEVVRRAEMPSLGEDEFLQALDSFRGSISQVPPLHSAIKVDGQKLYEIARAGGEAEIPVRQVHISKLEVLSWFPNGEPKASFAVECSGGTYIRSLVRDIGRAVGSAATMTFLVRTRSGGFPLAEAVSVEEFAQSPRLVPFETAIGWCAPTIVTDDEATAAMTQGKRAPMPTQEAIRGGADGRLARAHQQGAEADIVVFRNGEGTIFVLARRQGDGSCQPNKVFNLAA